MNTARGLRTGGLMLLALGLAIAYASQRGRPPVQGASPMSAPQVPEYLHEWETLSSAGHRVGYPDAPITILVAHDLQCSACATAHPILERVAQARSPNVALVFLHNPLSVHPFAMQAAVAAECASREVPITGALATIFRMQDSLGLQPWEDFGVAAGVQNASGFRSCMREPLVRAAVESQRRAALDFGMTVTPSIVVNGWLFRGVVEQATLDRVIGALLAGEQPPGVAPLLSRAGTPVADTVGGVPVVRLSAAVIDAAPRLRVAPEPTIVLAGDESGDFDLHDAGDVMLFGDARVATFAALSSRLLVFPLNGGEPRSVGRAGGGPGERERVANAVPGRGDTIVMIDAAKRALIHVAVRTGDVRIVALPESLPARASVVTGELPDGSVLLRDESRLPGPDANAGAIRADSVQVYVLSASGELARIALLRDGLSYSVEATRFARAGLETESLRLGPRARIVLWDTLIVTTESDSMFLTVWDRRGRPRVHIALEHLARHVDRSMRARFIQEELSRSLDLTETADAALRLETERLIRSARFAERLPAVHALIVGNDRTLWVVAGIAPTDSSWCAVGLRLDGSVTGRICGTGGGRPVAFGRGLVVLKVEATDGASALEVRRVLPDPQPGR